MVIMYGEKKPERYPNPTKITRTSREKLIKLAGGSYDPEISLIDARKMRIEANDIPKPVITDEQIDTHDEDLINEIEAEKEDNTEEVSLSEIDVPKEHCTVYHLPEDITKIDKLKVILRTCT